MEDENHLFERDLKGQCKAGMRCVYRAAEKTAVTITWAGTELAKKIVETYGRIFGGSCKDHLWQT